MDIKELKYDNVIITSDLYQPHLSYSAIAMADLVVIKKNNGSVYEVIKDRINGVLNLQLTREQFFKDYGKYI